MKTTLTFILLLASHILIGQNSASNYSFISNDSLPEQHHVTHDITSSREGFKNERKYSSNSLNDKKWDKIKKQILKNKRKALNHKEGISSSRIMDTIFIQIPANRRESRLSGY
ncbi:hypothetical protein [Aquimarina sediminis]|uniref:hypothetical protein n=1 Tax=Aquimarina sediminis TaxID=2070536 RepID=UPI000CA071D7|nr:hypothetical protein [Aquimarina sediminis]